MAQQRWAGQQLLVRRDNLERLYEAGCALLYQARVLGGGLEYGRKLAASLADVAGELGIPFSCGLGNGEYLGVMEEGLPAGLPAVAGARSGVERG